MSFIKLDRRLLNWEWKNDPNMVALWIEILLQANYCDAEWHGQKYEKGSFPTSLEKLASATGLTIRQIRTCLEKLQSTHELTIRTTHKGSKIIVNKWEEYQCTDESDTQNDKQSDKQTTRRLTSKPTNKESEKNTIKSALNDSLSDNTDTQNDKQNAQKRHTERTQNDNTIRNKEIKNIRKKEINIYNGAFLDALNDFKRMRKSIKKPLTDEAEKRLINRLKSLSTSEEEQIQMLNNATDHCWLSVYALKKQEEIKPSNERYKQEWLNEE